MSKISRFTGKVVTLAESAVGGFADYAVVSLHCLRIYLKKSYREALDLLSEMPQILANIGLDAADLSDHPTAVKAFDRIKMAVWRVLLYLSAFTKAQLLCSPQNSSAILGRSCTSHLVTRRWT